MTEQQRQAAIDYYRAQIARANAACRSGQWSPSQSANHRESHERLLREITPRQ